MKFRLALPVLFAACLSAQGPAPTMTVEAELPPEMVIASVGDMKITYGEIQAVLRSMPPQNQQAALADRRKFVEQYAMLRRLTEYAEKEKLDQKSPYKEAVVFARMQVLYQAAINHKADEIDVTPEAQKKFFDENKDRYTQAQVKVIYIPFSATPPPQTDPKAKKVLNEAEARAKAEGLVKQIKGGADFVKLVKEHSEDPTSVAKDGDFPAIKKSDKLPEEIKKVVFALKPGDVSEPVRQPNGFYVFRLEQISEEPYAKVKDNIANELKSQQLNEWLRSTQTSIALKVENDQFFNPKTQTIPMPPPQAAPQGGKPAAPAGK